MPRTKPADQRRAELMAAAQALFVHQGVAATSVDDVTSRAGVSKGLFYQYFHSKDDLVLALQEAFAYRLSDRMRAAVAGATTWPDKLDAAIRACFLGFQSEHLLHEVLFRHVGRVESPHRQSSHHLLVEAFRALLTDGVSVDAFVVEDVASTALLLACTMHAFDPTFLALTPDRLSGRRLLHATQTLARRAAGLATPPPPRRRRSRAH